MENLNIFLIILSTCLIFSAIFYLTIRILYIRHKYSKLLNILYIISFILYLLCFLTIFGYYIFKIIYIL